MVKIAFISDIHYYSAELGTTGKAYESAEAASQTCMKESREILSALCERFAADDSDAVCIAGDITKNGEAEAHREAIEILDRLNSVKPVIVITSTHDWCSNSHAHRYEGDEDVRHENTVSIKELPCLYSHFGEELRHSQFMTGKEQYSASYILNNEVMLLALNEDCDGVNGSSGYSCKHLEWIFAQTCYAKENNLKLIAFQHHLMLDNISHLINRSQMISENEETASFFAGAGINLIFTGHSHFQRISRFTDKNGKMLTQLNLGAISGFPGLITYVCISDGKANISEMPYDFIYDNNSCGQQYFRNQTSRILYTALDFGATNKDRFFEFLNNNGIKSKALNTFYPFIRHICKKITSADVKRTAKKINRIMMKQIISPEDYNKLDGIKLTKLIEDTFLNLFWSGNAGDQFDAEKNTVCAVSAIPEILIKRIPLPKSKKAKLKKLSVQIEELVKELEYPENNCATIELNQ